MTAQDALMDGNSRSTFKNMLKVGVYTVAVAIGAMGGLMALLLVA